MLSLYAAVLDSPFGFEPLSSQRALPPSEVGRDQDPSAPRTECVCLTFIGVCGIYKF